MVVSAIRKRSRVDTKKVSDEAFEQLWFSKNLKLSKAERASLSKDYRNISKKYGGRTVTRNDVKNRIKVKPVVDLVWRRANGKK